MTRRTSTITATALFIVLAAGVAGQQQTGPERTALRTQLEERFDIVPLSDAVGLRPKTRMGDVRLIEVADTISINGVVVTGRELRDRLGRDAEAILRLSYLDAEARRVLFAAPAPSADSGPVRAPEASEPALEQVAPLPPSPPTAPEPPTRGRQRASGDRVRIFGDIHVRENESLSGQAVAVMGSVRVDGEVGDQVVAVMGSVHLGPNAIVRGDIVSVGGRVVRAAGAQVGGDVTEVSLGGGGTGRLRGLPLVIGPGLTGYWDGFSAVPRLIGTTFRLLLLALLASVVLLVARPVVEGAAQRVSDTPIPTILVGMLAGIMLGPVLFLLSMILIISIVGLPLLIAIPFLLIALLLMALAGFSGTAYSIGQWARRRLGLTPSSPFLDVSLGVLIILLPLLLGRVLALAGWWGGPIALLFVVVGFSLEFLAWSSGFGAVLMNGFGRWQARRVVRAAPVAPPTPPPPSVGL
ncbi:hypothetical protein BH23ACI1_BH23ACI1_30070 [soil metagenome]